MTAAQQKLAYKRPGHRLCTCLSDDGNPMGFGKPIKCYKMQDAAMADCRARTTEKDPLMVRRCMAGCDHWHIYSIQYLRAVELAAEIDRLGPEKALEVLKCTDQGTVVSAARIVEVGEAQPGTKKLLDRPDF